jgi:hypothetical protein
VASSILAADENHRDPGDLRHLLRVVTSAARHFVTGNPQSASGSLDGVNKHAIAWTRLMVGGDPEVDLKSPPPRDLAHALLMRGAKVAISGELRVARVDSEAHLPWNDRSAVWFDEDSPDRRDRGASDALSGADQRRHDLRESRHWVAPQVHRKGASVVSDARELDIVVTKTGNARDHGDRQIRVFEHRALLDMQFDKALDVVSFCLAGALRMKPDGAHRLGDRLVVIADSFVRIGRSDCAGDGAPPPKVRGRKPAPFLFAQGHGLQGSPRLSKARRQRLDRREGRDGAQRAVVASTRPLRVNVRAADDCGAAVGALQSAPDVADGIARHREAGLATPLSVEVCRGDPFRRIDGAPNPRFPISAVLREG